MDTASLSELRNWLTEAALAGKSETALLDGFCRRALDAGLPIARAALIIDTLHPVHEGRAFLWRREGGETQAELVEYGPTSEGEAAENWRRSVFFHLLQTGGSVFRVRFHAGETADYTNFARMRDEGMSDVVAMLICFAGARAIGEMDRFIPIGGPIIPTASTTRMWRRSPA
jgi:adenylate cyclase